MTRLTARHLLFPTADARELSVRRMREGFELIFVAVFTSFAADVVVGLVSRRLTLLRVRRSAGTQPNKGREYGAAK